jgi:hypothetical protein
VDSKAELFYLSEGEIAAALAAARAAGAGAGESTAGGGRFAPFGQDARAAALANPALAAYRGEIAFSEEGQRAAPVPGLPFGLFRLFDETGDRSAYEGPYFERRRRLAAAGLASWLWGKPESIRHLEDLVWAICDEYTWALPAHFDGASLDPGSLDSECLDLFACETAFALAELLSLVGDSLAPIVAARGRAQVEKRVLAPFLARKTPWRWELMVNNWCAVCAGSVGAAALYLHKDGARAAKTLARALPTLDRFLDSFSPDGVCLEGLGYWTYGFGYFTAFADLLRAATKGSIDLLADGRARKAAAFQSAAYLDDKTALSFADGSTRERWRRGLSAYLARRFPEAPLPARELAADFSHDHYGRWALSFRDLVWDKPVVSSPGTTAAPESRGVTGGPRWFPEAQWLIQPAAAPGFPAFAAKGGHNDEPHNHNDLGSFELVLDGIELLADLGCGEYTKAYFNEDRYSIFCNSSFGHSVPIIDGRGQSEGARRAARVLSFTSEGGRTILSLEIAGAYDCPRLESLVRRFEFDGCRRLVVTDSFAFAEAGASGASPAAIIERFVTRAPDSLERLVGITCSRPDASLAIISHAHAEHDGTKSLIKSLDYGVHTDEDNFTISFEFSLR